MAKKKVSPSGLDEPLSGFKGWRFSTWLKKNKGNLRLVAAGVLGLLTTALTDLSAPWAVSLLGVVTVGSKLALDAFDYWLSEVDLE